MSDTPDFSHCVNNECIDRHNCSRFTDKPFDTPIWVQFFETPKTSGACPFFILNTEDNKQK